MTGTDNRFRKLYRPAPRIPLTCLLLALATTCVAYAGFERPHFDPHSEVYHQFWNIELYLGITSLAIALFGPMLLPRVSHGHNPWRFNGMILGVVGGVWLFHFICGVTALPDTEAANHIPNFLLCLSAIQVLPGLLFFSLAKRFRPRIQTDEPSLQ